MASSLTSEHTSVLYKGTGLTLLIWGIYVLSTNIHFATTFMGIAAGGAILALVLGVLMLIYLPEKLRNLGWLSLVFGILVVFYYSRAFLHPTSMWRFLVSFAMISAGGKMFVSGRSPL